MQKKEKTNITDFHVFKDELQKKLFKQDKKVEFFTAIDVGATNTRVAIIFKHENENSIVDRPFDEKDSLVYKFKCSSVTVLENTLKRIDACLLYQDTPDDEVREARGSGAVLAIAGPIDETRSQVIITNYTTREIFLKDNLPKRLFPKETTYFLNDLASTCYGILNIGLTDRTSEFFANVWDSSSDIKLRKRSYAVLAMGTGLGCGAITYNPVSQEYHVAEMEAGHCLIPFVGDEYNKKDNELLRFLGKKLYNYEGHPIEYEDICSGRGLQYCYEFEVLRDNAPPKFKSSKQIANRVKTDKYAREAMLSHYRFLMKAAQNIVIMANCKGVFFAGDNQVHNKEFVGEISHELEDEFLFHPRSEWLEKMEAYRQIKSFNFNLQGCFFYIQRYVIEKIGK